MIKQINTVGTNEEMDQILFTQTTPVSFPLTEQAKEFVQDLYDTIKSLPGLPLGLAANQIAEDLDFIPSMLLALESFDAQGDPVYKLFINPELRTMGSSFKSKEGCYSVPGKSVSVRRKKNIEIKYFTLNDKDEPEYFIEKIYGEVNPAATIIQHEYDHLLGITIDG